MGKAKQPQNPRRVCIAGYEYPVVVRPGLRYDGEGVGGLYIPDTQIMINGDSSPDRRAMNLLHEVLHGINRHFIVPEILKLTDEQEEILVTALAPALWDTMRRNQWLTGDMADGPPLTKKRAAAALAKKVAPRYIRKRKTKLRTKV
jgi:hypothetical protein